MISSLDIVIILVLLADIFRGARIGFSRQFFSFAGFWGGLFIAALLAPHIAGFGHTATAKVAIILGVTAIIAIGLSSLGELVGIHLSQLVRKYGGRPIDAGLGAIFGALLVCLSVWILASMLLNVPQQGISQLIQQSKIVRVLDGALPAAPQFIARIQRLIDPNGFPQVFIGPEPAPGTSVEVATSAEVTAAASIDSNSVVKIQGIGCGGEVFGSGWISSSGTVVTNAHVVSGIKNPLVLDKRGVHTATTRLFDPSLDIAVLKTDVLDGTPLKTSSAVAAVGTHAVALGYPGGGPFTASAAGIIQSYTATGRNIYDAGITARRIYELGAVVQPGNSGGPLVLPDGTVIGVIFARSESNDAVGYALTMPAVLSDIKKAEGRTSNVSTGACAAD